MIRTTYTCDRCASEFEEANKVRSVCISIGHGPHIHSSSSVYRDTSIHLCEDCMKKMQIRIRDRKKAEAQNQPVRTVEDVLTELAEMINLKFEE
jgi:hypothetical protein